MSFGLHIEQRGATGRLRASQDTTGPLTAIALVLVAFCVYDYSPYGHGFVAAALGDAQRWFQAFTRSFHLKM